MDKEKFNDIMEELKQYIEVLQDSMNLTKKEIKEEKKIYLYSLWDNGHLTNKEYNYILKKI